jgi:RimJ/RimL family protein N-acetyltransferase
MIKIIRTTETALVPVLETERLILRDFREEDAPAVAELHGDAEVMRYIGPEGLPDASLLAAWKYIAVQVGHWTMKKYGKWAVVEKAGGRFIGRVGFYDPPYEWPGLELGWTLCRDVWGKGYAPEAACAALKWGFDNLSADEIISAIFHGNMKSVRVAEKLGERLLREGTMHGKPCLIYGISRAEYLKR